MHRDDRTCLICIAQSHWFKCCGPSELFTFTLILTALLQFPSILRQFVSCLLCFPLFLFFIVFGHMVENYLALFRDSPFFKAIVMLNLSVSIDCKRRPIAYELIDSLLFFINLDCFREQSPLFIRGFDDEFIQLIKLTLLNLGQSINIV